jgi:AraC family transcriptional regulator
MVGSVKTPWSIEHYSLDCLDEDKGKWRKRSLPVKPEQIEFLTAHICDSISCTVSTCLFEQDFHSQIRYKEPTTLLVFGIEGISKFKFENKDLTCVVRPGDVWLFSVCDESLLRFTPAQMMSRMTVIKYASSRINQAFHQRDKGSVPLDSGNLVRLGFQQKPDDWIEELVNNQLLSMGDRLLAEAKALELIAHWYLPLNNKDHHGHSVIQTVKDLLIHNLANPPTLEKLAQQVGMSHTCLNSQFKKQHGTTVFNWLRQYRMARAKNYLDDVQFPITQIALNCGFSSASHFTQKFKEEYGETPSEYRKKKSKTHL